MKTRLLVASVLAIAAVGSLSLRSYGQTAPTPVTCYAPSNSSSPLLTYDVRSGVTISGSAIGGSDFTGTVPLTIGDEPNPHFDRLYALLMKGADGRLANVCLDGANSSNGTIASVRLRAAAPSDVQKVQICESGTHGSCAGIYGGSLQTYDLRN